MNTEANRQGSYTRFTEYGWRGAKREFIHSVTVYVCCQEDTFSVNHRRVIWSLREAGMEASIAKRSRRKLEVLHSPEEENLAFTTGRRKKLLTSSQLMCYSRTVWN